MHEVLSPLPCLWCLSKFCDHFDAQGIWGRMAPHWALADARWAFSLREQARWGEGGQSRAVDQAQHMLSSAVRRPVFIPLLPVSTQTVNVFGPTDYPIDSASGSGPSSWSSNTAKVSPESVETADPGWEDGLLRIHFPYMEKQLTHGPLNWSCQLFLTELS